MSEIPTESAHQTPDIFQPRVSLIRVIECQGNVLGGHILKRRDTIRRGPFGVRLAAAIKRGQWVGGPGVGGRGGQCPVRTHRHRKAILSTGETNCEPVAVIGSKGKRFRRPRGAKKARIKRHMKEKGRIRLNRGKLGVNRRVSAGRRVVKCSSEASPELLHVKEAGRAVDHRGRREQPVLQQEGEGMESSRAVRSKSIGFTQIHRILLRLWAMARNPLSVLGSGQIITF